MSHRALTVAVAGLAAVLVAFALLIGSRAGLLDGGGDDGDGAASATVADAGAPQASPTATDHGFAVWARNQDGTPVRWDPCTPIEWVLDDAQAPEGAHALVSRALGRIAAASGLEFRYAGRVREAPARDRALVVDEDGERRWAPVLVTWVPGGSTDLPLGDDERGIAVPVAVREGATRAFVTGQVVLNSDRRLLPGFEDRHASWGAVVLHELGHLVGLDHVDDPAQLMHPAPGFGPVELADGDLAGLAAIGGDGGCVQRPTPRELDVTFD